MCQEVVQSPRLVTIALFISRHPESSLVEKRIEGVG